MSEANWHTLQLLTVHPETTLGSLEEICRDHGPGGEPNIWLRATIISHEYLDRTEQPMQVKAVRTHDQCILVGHVRSSSARPKSVPTASSG